MTRTQPNLRPIISTNLDFKIRGVSKCWKKRSTKCNNSRKSQIASKCRQLKTKWNILPSLKNTQSYIAEKDTWEFKPLMISKETQTIESGSDWDFEDSQMISESTPRESLPMIPESTPRESPGMIPESTPRESLDNSQEIFEDVSRESFSAAPNNHLLHSLHRKHQERRTVLDRVEKDLEERAFSRSDYFCEMKLKSHNWLYRECRIDGKLGVPQTREFSQIDEMNEMAPLISEIHRDPFQRERHQYGYEDDVFYKTNELVDFSKDFQERFPSHEASSTRNPIATILPENKRGKLVTFFKNGDPFFRGFTTSVNEKDFKNFDTLLQWLTEKVETHYSVRLIYSLHDGKAVRNIDEFKHSRSYVLAGSHKLNTSCTYGPRKQRFWSSQTNVRDKLRFGDIDLYRDTRHHGVTARGSPPNRRPRILTIISNLDRSSREKFILNPQTSMMFDDLVSDLTSLIRVPRPPVRSLYTERAPHIRIQSYSQLLREYKDHVNFIACGEEGKPTELTSKRHAPGSNSSTESTSSRPFQKARKFQKQSNSMSDGSQSRTDMSVALSTTHADTPFPRSGNLVAPIWTSRRRPKDHVTKQETIRINIHGRKKEFYPPSMCDSDDDGGKPDKLLKLDWVYGYRGKDARCNLFVIPSSEELLYFVGAVAVLYDRRKETQRHYCGHTEDITSMALHPGCRLVASGQQAGKSPESASHVRVWDTISLSTYSIVGLGDFQSSINSVAFSTQSQGDFILAVDDGDKHTISVWDWQNSKLVAKTTTTTDMVVWARFHNMDDSILLTCGKRHIYFWKLLWTSRVESEAKIIRDKESDVFKEDIPKFVTSMAFSPLGDVIVGDSNGHITLWSRDSGDVFKINHACSDNLRNAHKKSVFSMCFTEDGTLLSGGGNEIKAWDSNNYYRLIKERTLPESAGSIRTLVPSSGETADEILYIGTTKNYVLEGSLQHKFKFLIQGHSDKLQALAVHPKDPCFFTAGFDMQVCRWSILSRSSTWRVQLQKPCVSVTIDPGGKLLVVGTHDGKLVSISSGNGNIISSTAVSLRAISAVKFSPNGHFVAAGCQDGIISVFEVMDDGTYLRKLGLLKGHKTVVQQMDWSSDNRFLQTVSSDHELYFWEVEELHHVTAGRLMRDVDWSTQTCTLSCNIIGPWVNVKPGEDIRCVCRSTFREYLAVGISNGTLQLYKYPSSSKQAQCHSKKAFSSTVSSLQFTMEDRYVLTTGGPEAVLLQWAMKSTIL